MYITPWYINHTLCVFHSVLHGLEPEFGFIAGCVLAAVGMVCGVLIYKTRKSDVKYQPLKSDEI